MTAPLPELPPEVATAGRRTVLLLRAWRRRDLPAMNAVIRECERDGGATGVLTILLGWVSERLDRFPAEAVENMLADLCLDFAVLERRASPVGAPDDLSDD